MTGKRFYVKKITREERPRLFSSIGADYKYWIVDKMARGDGTGLGDAELRFNFSTEKRKADNVCDLLNQLSDENEQLKQELKIYRKFASCGNCHYHNYDWYEDGDEFEVCDKGNNVTDGICEEWKKL